MVKGHPMYKVLEPGYIPAIFEPEFAAIEQAEKQYYPEEPLIAVIVEGTARGYSTWHLDQHEVVNDVIEGRPITVTW